MTKRDYELLAGVLAIGAADPVEYFAGRLGTFESAQESQRRFIACELAMRLMHDNPSFSCTRFLTACKVTGMPVASTPPGASADNVLAPPPAVIHVNLANRHTPTDGRA